jgi:hypothetical protein
LEFFLRATSSPSQLDIVTVQDKNQLDSFIRLPWKFQAQDPCWVPPTISYHEKALDRKRGPFFEVGEAEYYLALRHVEPVGRITAHINRLHDEIHQDDTGFFGFFECENDPGTATALFETAAAWLRARGRKRIRGPLSFGIYDEVGLLVEGFDSLPAIMHTHNPPYYVDLVEGFGFTKACDWYALSITRERGVEGMQDKLDEIMENTGLRLERPRARDILLRRDEVLDLFNESWEHNWGHVPFTRKHFQGIIKELLPILRPDLMRLMLDKDDRIAAFIITVPDLNPTLKKFDGRLNLLHKARLLYEARLKPLKHLRTLLLGVKREYQRKRLHHALILCSYLDFYQHRSIQSCDCSLIPEQLTLYMRALGKYGAKRYKIWRIYDRDL